MLTLKLHIDADPVINLVEAMGLKGDRIPAEVLCNACLFAVVMHPQLITPEQRQKIDQAIDVLMAERQAAQAAIRKGGSR